MERSEPRGLKELAERRLAEINRMEQTMGQRVGQSRDIDGPASVSRCPTPLSGGHGTQRVRRQIGEQARCVTCMELEQVGVATLICSTCGYQHPKVKVIRALSDHGLLTPTEIAARTGLDPLAVQAELDRLVESGAAEIQCAGVRLRERA